MAFKRAVYSTGVLERCNFVIERLPLAVEDVRARDDDVDLLRARFYAAVNLIYALGERRKACGKSGGDGCDGEARSLPVTARTAVSTNA